MTSSVPSGVYKIISAPDSNCVDCEGGGGKKKTRIIAWHYEGRENQKFQIHNEGSGFRVASLVKTKDNMLLVIDHSAKEKGIVLLEFNGDPTQQWAFVPARGSGGSYLMKNVSSGLCLRNMGHGSPLQPVPEAMDDKSQWWNLIPVETEKKE